MIDRGIRSGHLPGWEQLEAAARHYAEFVGRLPKAKRFVKHGSTFFGRSGAWKPFVTGSSPDGEAAKPAGSWRERAATRT